MLTLLSMYEQKRNDICFLCSNALCDIKSFPNICDHLFHYKCLRNYVDNKLEKNESITCPMCNKIFHQIANQYKKSNEVLYQNVILSNDESQCCICFSKYKSPVASTDTCSHTFCFECIKKWCTFKHECPMDRMPIKLLLLSDFPGGHITRHEEPPPIQEDLDVTEADNDEILNTTCEICNLGNNDHLLLLCDSCNKGYHIYCLTSPLSEIPEGDWFCDECSNDDSEVPRGTRRFRRVIDDLQLRYTSTQNSNDNRHMPNRRTRTRGLRNTHNEDSDWEDEIDVPQRNQRILTRTRTVPQIISREGIRRSLRNRRLNNNSDEELGMQSLSLQRRNRMRVIEETDEETTSESANSSISNEQDREYFLNLNERRIRTRAIRQRNDNEEPTMSSRNRQGSLSSEPESEIEPCKKKPRLMESSSSSPDDEDEEDDTTSESVKSSQILTRKRSQNATENIQLPEDNDDCPFPRKLKKLRMIDESSRGESDEDLSCKTDSDSQDTKETNSSVKSSEETDLESGETKIIGNFVKSSDEIQGKLRMRHISTSSSLSTIPCRTTDRPRVRGQHKSIQKPTPCAQVLDIFTDSSNSDNTDSDYDPSNEVLESLPSTSKKSPISKKVKLRNKKRKKHNNKNSKKKRVSKKKSSSTVVNDPNISSKFSRRLNILDRENRLPVVTNEELNVKYQSSSSVANSNCALNEDNSQTNHRFKDETTSGIAKMNSENQIEAPSTSTHSNHRSHFSQRFSVATHSSKSDIPNSDEHAQNLHSNVAHNNTGSNSSSLKLDFDKIIKKYLSKYYEQGRITKAENNALSERILQKIMTRNNQEKIPAKSSVEEFSKKYLDFYLKKRK